jgi:hypothetical protein
MGTGRNVQERPGTADPGALELNVERDACTRALCVLMFEDGLT